MITAEELRAALKKDEDAIELERGKDGVYRRSKCEHVSLRRWEEPGTLDMVFQCLDCPAEAIITGAERMQMDWRESAEPLVRQRLDTPRLERK